MKHVPNHDKVPFKDMTPEERSAIVEALLIGDLEHHVVHKDQWNKNCANDFLNPLAIYRTKPRQLIIPWEHIKPEYKWAAIGFDGAKSVEVFTHEPSISDDAWNYQSSMSTLEALNIDTTGIDWRDSLVQRPEGV